MRHVVRGTTLVAMLICAPVVSAQTTTQLWGNLTFDWVKSERLAYELDVEPKVLLGAPEGEPGWRNLDVTPNVEFSARRWLDLVAEATVGRTVQTDDLSSTELTPRLGMRFHLFSRAQKFRVIEQAPLRRLVVRDLLRVESRNAVGDGFSTTENIVNIRVKRVF